MTAVTPQPAAAAAVAAGPAAGPAAAATAVRAGRVLRDLTRRPLALVSLGWLAAVAVAAATASWLPVAAPQQEDLSQVLAGPGARHWLGTDRLGRDVLSRLIYGARPTLAGVAEAVAVFAVLGITLGLAAGFLGGWTDRVVARVSDLLLAMPGIIVLLMVLAVFPANELATMIALGLITCPVLLRVVRGATMGIRSETYIKAARLSGLTTPRIMVRHVLPRLGGPIIVQLSLFAATAVLAQSALSFLGLSTPETQGPSWGNMVAEAAAVISQDPWLLLPAGGVLVLTVLALGLLGDAVRDVTAGRHLGPAHPRRPRRRRAAAGSGAGGPGAGPPAVPAQTAGARAAGARDDSARDDGPLLSVDGLTIAFGDVTAVRDVSFSLAPGEALGIVGESGCGKTVTARALVGLLPRGGMVTAGSVTFGGRDLLALAERDFAAVRGHQIGLISQEPMRSLDPSFRVGSQLAEVIRRHQPQPRARARARAEELLAMVNLPGPAQVLRSYPHELSGGMAQRVSIALALAGQPRLLIADEPTTALDVTVQAEILALLRDLRQRLGMAVILVTHDWGVLADLCDRAIVMYAGEVVEQAGLADMCGSPRHPYTEGLLAANPHLAPAGGALPAIPGTVPPPSAWPAGCHFEPRCRYATGRCSAAPIPLTEPAPARLTRCIHADRLAAAP